jgi:hypothetical protein
MNLDREGLDSKKGAQEVIYNRGSKSGCLPVELGVAITWREVVSVGEITWDSNVANPFKVPCDLSWRAQVNGVRGTRDTQGYSKKGIAGPGLYYLGLPYVRHH